jgi:uncharacterized repeat protein (TIGR01451 family)
MDESVFPRQPVPRTITITVVPTATGKLTNTVSVSSPTPDFNPANDSFEYGTVVPAAADLDLSLSLSGPEPSVVGDTITFTLAVTNNGPSAATNVQLNNVISGTASYTNVLTSAADMSCGPLVVDTITCDLASLDPGASTVVTVSLESILTGSIENHVVVESADTYDYNDVNNVRTIMATVE